MPREKARKNLRKSIVNYERDFPNWRGYVSKFHAITNRYGELALPPERSGTILFSI